MAGDELQLNIAAVGDLIDISDEDEDIVADQADISLLDQQIDLSLHHSSAFKWNDWDGGGHRQKSADMDGGGDIYAFDLDVSRVPPFGDCEVDLDRWTSDKHETIGIQAQKHDRCSAAARPIIAKKRTHSAADHTLFLKLHRKVVVRVILMSGQAVAEAAFDLTATVHQVRRWLAQHDGTGTRASELYLLVDDQMADGKSRLSDLITTTSSNVLEFQLVRQKMVEERDYDSLEKFLNASDSSDTAYMD